MSGRVDFRILGPVEVVLRSGPLPLSGTRKALLTALVLAANEPVTIERLIDELWGDQVPPTALKMVRNAVSQLRGLIGRETLVTRAGGYELRIGPDELDALRFERLAREGGDALAAGDPETAARKLRDALGLWRGPALADFVYASFAHAAIARLEELRLNAVEDRIEAELELGRHGDLVGELEALVAEQPLRERLRAQLMLALYRSGRQAEALGAYQQTRRLLVDELGLEPGPVLQRLEQAILRHDPALEPARRPPAPAALPRETRRTVTVLFAELTAAPQSDPEARRALLADAAAAAAAVLARHGASVERFHGVAVLGVFGVPAAHEDDALRALRAAEELRRELGEAVRAGIDAGRVIATAEGVEGEVVAGALRLARAAAPGDALVGEGAERVLRGAALLEPVAGPDAPAWRVAGLVRGAPAIARRFDTPLVGRRRELALLRNAFERSVRRHGAEHFTLLGAAGIGKSKLAREFAASLGDEATVLTGHCLPYGEGITFWPLREVVAGAVGSDVTGRVAALLNGDPNAAAVAAGVAGAVGAGDPVASREETFLALRRLFEALATERPLALVLEDVHWAEPTFLDLVEHVADLGRAPIVLLCLARPELLELRPLWAGGRPHVRSILLEPLSKGEAELLIATLVGERPLPPEARARLAQAAEGNPLFLEQMLALLEDETADGEPSIPPTIQALLASRLDRLDRGELGVLERASVIGRRFARDSVVALSPAEEQPAVDPLLEALVRKELVRPEPAGHDDFRFVHLLVREAAYDSVPKWRRADLHERYADRLETAGADALEELVGYHLEQAQRYLVELGSDDERVAVLAGRAAERLASAGRRAYAYSDVPAAAGLLARAAALRPPGAPGRAELLADLGEALRERGELLGAAATFDELDAEARRQGDRVLEAYAAVCRGRLQLVTTPGVNAAALARTTRQAMETFERAGEDGLLAKALELLAAAAWFRCRAGEAEEALERAVEHARRAGDARIEAQCLNLSIGAAVFGPLHVSHGLRRCDEIRAQPGAQQRVVASSLRALAALSAMEGRFDDARTHLAGARSILADLGLALAVAQSAETGGGIELLAGDAEAAERELRLGYERLERRAASTRANVAALLAHALVAQARDDEALRFSQIAEQASARDDLSAQVHWRLARVRALAGLGRLEEALPAAREAVELAARTDFLNVHADALAALADVTPDGPRPAAEQALELYERKGNVVAADALRTRLAPGPPQAA